jgi:hypothetical protein
METATFTLRDLVDQASTHERLLATIDERLRRFAYLGGALLVIADGYLAAALRFPALAKDGQRPPAALVGWDVLQRALQLDGKARAALAAGLAALAAAVVLALVTRGFTIGRLWSHLGSLLIGLAGLVAIVPPAIALAILVANVLLWFVIGVLAFALGSALLVGLVSAAVER